MNLLSILLQAPAGGSQWSGILMMVVIVAIFYFFMIRPQQKKQKEILAKIDLTAFKFFHIIKFI